ncbi:MAG: carboxypeptidase-like regulatory domain-containing protein [Bacteroidota bacterium]|nr:carboxypeptidase-like regulatory domain-containing protein [Bacteroidota bacterium]
MKKILISFFLIGSLFSSAQTYNISGHVKDGQNGEDISGASITVKDRNNKVLSNSYGFYSLSLPKGSYEINCIAVNFDSYIQLLELTSDTTLNIELKVQTKELESVTIKEKRSNKNVEKVEMSTVQLSSATIKRIPAVLGEVDVIKSIQLLPGVSTVGEGATGFNVRGGSVDQNLILQDEAPIYNSSHALGFFSVFNPDAVKDVKLIKGGIPANYGGRLSSVLDIRMKDGNMKKFHGSGGIGTIFSRVMLEGPIVKDKSSYMVAFRRSYIDLFFPFASNAQLKKSSINFTDFNAKFNYILDKKNRLYVSGYYGRDAFGFADLFATSWGNTNLTVRWNHLYNNRKHFANITGVVSNYNYDLGSTSGSSAFKWISNIRFYNLKYDHTYYINSNNTFLFGGNMIYYDFNPGQTDPVTGQSSFINQIKMEKKFAIEPNLYISNEQTVSRRLTLQYGIRYNGFAQMGKSSVYTYSDPNNRIASQISDTTVYDAGKIIKFYQGLEPRISFKYSLKNSNSIKGSYNRTRQNIHLITQTSAATPLDIYWPSDNYFKPQVADQVALGYFQNFKRNIYETSVEVFYKKYMNVIDFKSGAQLIANPALETEMLRGIGYSYGAEFFVRKTEGKLTGWISYTYSRTRRQIVGINEDKWYFAPYDKTNNLSITASYEFTKKWTFGSNCVYSTGAPITGMAQKFTYQGYLLGQASLRNSIRVPDYFRIDFSASFKPRKRKYWQGEWVFSAYNVTSRRNAYSVYFRQNTDTKLTEAVRISVFGSIIPAVTYNFNF